jgi:acyl dehydratase
MEGGSRDEYYVQYNTKDLIQYALSVGAGSNIHTYREDNQYVFENHINFSAIPTFAFILIFWAKRSGDGIGNTSTIPPFPPPIMKFMGVIPKESLKVNVDVHKYPLIHTSQSIVWENDLPIPTTTNNNVVVMIKGKFISVAPKSVGTFVTTEYVIYEKACGAESNGLTRIGTVQFTTLILGIPSKMVQPYSNSNKVFATNQCTNIDSMRSLVAHSIERKRFLILKVDYYITPNTAVMYRLASGDFNPMHVDPNAVPDMGHGAGSINKKEQLPFIHGLCTLGIVARIILQYVQRRYFAKCLVRYLDCRFKMPVFINDTIVIRAWEVSSPATYHDTSNDKYIEFSVTDKKSDSILVDSGKMYISLNHSNENSSKLRSYL